MLLFAQNFTRGYDFGFNGKESDNSTSADSYDFGARILDARIGRWLSVDPLQIYSPGQGTFNAFRNSPIVLVDPTGKKEKPFKKGKSMPYTPCIGTETYHSIYDENDNPIGLHPDHLKSYNCHSYAWHNSKGDPTDERNQDFIPLWDSFPDDDIKSTSAYQLNHKVRNIPNDIVVYFQDSNSDGVWQKGEEISHSALVKEVDAEGNTTVVGAKCGQGPLAMNHPGSPGYYESHNGYPTGKKLTRAYFRVGANIQKVGSIEFDSNTAKPKLKSDGTIDYLVVQDLKSGADYGVNRNTDGTYSFYNAKSEKSTQDKP
jgi:RHS repeat-associated protein